MSQGGGSYGQPQQAQMTPSMQGYGMQQFAGGGIGYNAMPQQPQYSQPSTITRAPGAPGGYPWPSMTQGPRMMDGGRTVNGVYQGGGYRLPSTGGYDQGPGNMGEGLRYAPPGIQSPTITNPDGTQMRTMFSRLPPGTGGYDQGPGNQLAGTPPPYNPPPPPGFNPAPPPAPTPPPTPQPPAPQPSPTPPPAGVPTSAGNFGGMVPNEQNNAWVPRTPEYDQKAIWQNPYVRDYMLHNPGADPSQQFPQWASQFANNPYSPYK